MNFFHVDSFEDHFTIKIWMKNWNFSISKNLFNLYHKINKLVNSTFNKE